MTIRIRPAVSSDIPVLRTLIDASVRGLQAQDYTPSQIERALATVYGVDTQFIADATYFVAEAESLIVGCGGWSKRKLFTAAMSGQDARLLCSTRNRTLQKFAPSSFIPRGHDGGLEP
jgi:hypothetical protein